VLAKLATAEGIKLSSLSGRVRGIISDSSESIRVRPKPGDLRAERNFRLVVRN